MLNKKYAAMISMGLLSASILLSGCSAGTGRSSEETTSAAAASSESDRAATQETVVSETTLTEELTVVEQRYHAIIEGYLQELPAQATGELAKKSEQDDLIAAMKALYDQKANSETIFSLYRQGIVKLSPEAADLFTAYAISGLRRNSFEDYIEIEQNYTKDPAFLEQFFAVAEKYEFNYLQMSRHTADVTDAKVRSLLDRAAAQGYLAVSTEGMVYYGVDFTQFAQFRAYNTPAMANLLISLAIDDLDPMANDGALVISDDLLAARTWNLEQMLKNYQATPYEKFLAVRLRDHIMLVMFGLDNTPNYDYETKQLTDDTQRMFNDITSLKHLQMGQWVAEFADLIEANGGKVEEPVFTQSQTIFDKIDAAFNLTTGDLEAYGQWMSGQAVVNG